MAAREAGNRGIPDFTVPNSLILNREKEERPAFAGLKEHPDKSGFEERCPRGGQIKEFF
jgi:hypothetical protein